MLQDMFSMPAGIHGVQTEGTSEDKPIILPVAESEWDLFVSQAYGKYD
jgi:hypothetical protein